MPDQRGGGTLKPFHPSLARHLVAPQPIAAAEALGRRRMPSSFRLFTLPCHAKAVAATAGACRRATFYLFLIIIPHILREGLPGAGQTLFAIINPTNAKFHFQVIPSAVDRKARYPVR